MSVVLVLNVDAYWVFCYDSITVTPAWATLPRVPPSSCYWLSSGVGPGRYSKYCIYPFI